MDIDGPDPLDADHRTPPVLLVVAEPDTARRVEAAVAGIGPAWPTYRLRTVADVGSALDAITEDQPVAVFLDLHRTTVDGSDPLDHLVGPHTDLAIIALVGEDPTAVGTVLQRGAHDALTTGTLSPELVARSVHHARERARLSHALRRSNAEVAAFADRVAHDLRSPLSIASGMLELVQRQAGDELSDELAHLVDRSVAATHRVTDLVATLLMYARAKRPDESHAPLDLAHTALLAAEAAGVEDDGGTVTVHDLPTVVANATSMQRVFQNLFTNAVRYAGPHRATAITVSASLEHGRRHVFVDDDGPGIAPEHREIVFAEGERLDQGGDGLGLGLPAVRATVERYGGQVWIEEPPDGRGTRVVLTFPEG